MGNIAEFNFYLHGDIHGYREWLSQQIGFPISDELLEKINNPFYEVTLRCRLNRDTGEVTLISAHL